MFCAKKVTKLPDLTVALCGFANAEPIFFSIYGLTSGTVMAFLRQNCAVFCRYLQICGLRKNHKKFRICDLRTGTPRKFADLR
jgi:hypothetical protein